MKTREAHDLGRQIADLIQTSQSDLAYTRLVPILTERIPFTMLDRIGAALTGVPWPALTDFLAQVAASETIGGWPVIGTALRQHFERDPAGVLAQCQAFIIQADVWHGVDNLGERVIGPALVTSFEPTLTRLTPWRSHPNRWVRRAIGVGVHVWAKRAKGAAKHLAQMEALLTFLEPLYAEPNIDAIKGIGWGLKTLGRYYPDLVRTWLNQQKQHQRPARLLMLRKALTYINEQ
jgi:3-methyladenine DNA glycosylase AlkD